MKKYSGGFTLIELLVVIAIIGILASVVLASLNSARTKAYNAKVRSQLSSMRAQAQLYTGLNNPIPAAADCGNISSFPGTIFETDNNGLGGLFKDIVSGTGSSRCYSRIDLLTGEKHWAVAVEYKNHDGAFCVDSTGNAKDKNTAGIPYTNRTDAIALQANTGIPMCN